MEVNRRNLAGKMASALKAPPKAELYHWGSGWNFGGKSVSESWSEEEAAGEGVSTDARGTVRMIFSLGPAHAHKAVHNGWPASSHPSGAMAMRPDGNDR